MAKKCPFQTEAKTKNIGRLEKFDSSSLKQLQC